GNDQEDALDAAPVVVGDEADKCPICLNPLLLRDLAILASCCHSFCLRCILQWAEASFSKPIAPSCPVDRRPFSIVYKRDTALGYIKIPVKKTTSKTSLETCGCNKRSEKERRSVLSAELISAYEEEPLIVRKYCGLEVQGRAQLTVPAAVSTDILSWWVPHEKGNAPCPEVMDSLDIERASNVNFVSEDNTEMVPMDCDSPKNDHDEFTSEPKVKNENTVCVNMVPASDSQDSEACQRPTEGEEVSVEQKEQGANRQRRSRFHSPSTTWSPKSKKEQEQSEFRSKDNASRSKAEQRRSRSRSRDRDRDRDWDRTKSWSSRYRSRASSRDRDGQKKLAESESQREASLEWARAKNPDWVKEKMNADSEARGQSVGTNSPRWEEGCNNGVGDSWTRSTKQGGWNPDHRRSSGWGQRGEPTQNWWQARNSSFSGSSNHSGNDSYSRFNENRFNRRKGETDHSEPPVDRSGWSSASSWAVCRTLPADVQDYYSRRGRGSAASGGGWNRQEETAVQGTRFNFFPPNLLVTLLAVPLEPPQSEPNTQGSGGPQLPVNMMHHPQYPPQAVGPQAVGPQTVAPLLPFPASAQGQPLKLPPGPFAVPQQKVLSSVTSQGGSRPGGTVAPGPSKAQGSVSQGVPGVALPSSTTQPRSTDKRPASKGSADGDTHADSSKKEKKLQIQEKAVQEVKMAIKPYYQNKDITKEEYKEIVRKAVEKVCHSRSGEVNSGKVANLVKAYVEKYKHDRRNKSENHKS
ncbi:hypothetical protein Z043_111196, partial [Scleropages formosus]